MNTPPDLELASLRSALPALSPGDAPAFFHRLVCVGDLLGDRWALAAVHPWADALRALPPVPPSAPGSMLWCRALGLLFRSQTLSLQVRRTRWQYVLAKTTKTVPLELQAPLLLLALRAASSDGEVDPKRRRLLRQAVGAYAGGDAALVSARATALLACMRRRQGTVGCLRRAADEYARALEQWPAHMQACKAFEHEVRVPAMLAFSVLAPERALGMHPSPPDGQFYLNTVYNSFLALGRVADAGRVLEQLAAEGCGLDEQAVSECRATLAQGGAVRRWLCAADDGEPLPRAPYLFCYALDAGTREHMACARCNLPGRWASCGGCRMVRYCGESCRDAEWAVHSAVCVHVARCAPPSPAGQ